MANDLLGLLAALQGYGQGSLQRQQKNEARTQAQADFAALLKQQQAEHGPQQKQANADAASTTQPIVTSTPLGDRLARSLVPAAQHGNVFGPTPTDPAYWLGHDYSQDFADYSRRRLGQPPSYIPATTPSAPATLPNPAHMVPLASQAALPRPDPGLSSTYGLSTSRVAAGYDPSAQNRQATFSYGGRNVTYNVTG